MIDFLYLALSIGLFAFSFGLIRFFSLLGENT